MYTVASTFSDKNCNEKAPKIAEVTELVANTTIVGFVVESQESLGASR